MSAVLLINCVLARFSEVAEKEFSDLKLEFVTIKVCGELLFCFFKFKVFFFKSVFLLTHSRRK